MVHRWCYQYFFWNFFFLNPKLFWIQHFFKPKIILDPKFFLGPIFFFRPKIYFRFQNFFGPEIFFSGPNTNTNIFVQDIFIRIRIWIYSYCVKHIRIHSNIQIYSNIRIYFNIRIYSNMFYTIRIYSYSYSDENFLNEYIRIRIRSWKKYSLISDLLYMFPGPFV